ncbi:MAG: OmpA family protein [Deltaproteobacteria bacterium]|nr:OmpA family protein [Deltaproteobacteria bacterium]
MKIFKLWAVPVILGVVIGLTAQRSVADEYDESQSNPLRVVAYLAHPIGVLTEWVFFRPLHYLVSANKSTEYVFGHRPHPPLFPESPAYDYGITKRVALAPLAQRVKVVPPEPVAERVTVKEVAVEKTVTVEVPRVVEVERVVFPDIAFAFNSADLTDVGKGRAYLAAQKLKEKEALVVVVEGHTDAVGSEEYNLKLGLRRAEKVIQELTELGIDPARVSALSLGESKPLIELETDWARAVNRRVEFTVKAQ